MFSIVDMHNSPSAKVTVDQKNSLPVILYPNLHRYEFYRPSWGSVRPEIWRNIYNNHEIFFADYRFTSRMTYDINLNTIFSNYQNTVV